MRTNRRDKIKKKPRRSKRREKRCVGASGKAEDRYSQLGRNSAEDTGKRKQNGEGAL